MQNHAITGPFEFIIGANDLEKTAHFLEAFGFDARMHVTTDANSATVLYGDAEARHQLVLSQKETETTVRLVKTNVSASAMEAFAAGGHGIDFYTRDISAVIDDASGRGGSRPSPVSWTIDTGRHLTEARIISPDESFTVFCVSYSPGGIPTVLDAREQDTVSEVSLTSWIIPPDLIEQEFAFWSETFGFRNIRRTILDENAMVDLMKLPHPAAMGCSMYADERPRCPVDLLWYPGRSSPLRSDWPLQPGLFALGFKAGSPEVSARLEAGSTRVVVDNGGGETLALLTGRSPGGIRYQVKV